MALIGSVAAALALLAAGLALVTLRGARAFEARFPPRGAFVALEGGAIHVVDRAARRPERGAVLLIHGASGNHADMLNALGDRLTGEGFRVLAVDRPGHGWSSRFYGRAASSPAKQARLVHASLTQLGVGQAIVVGHSLGGVIALALALDAPRFVRGLALISTVSHPWPGGIALYYTLAANRWVGPAFRRLLVLPIGQLMLPGAVASVFAPNPTPLDYIEATGLPLALRPRHYKANAEDVVDLKANVAAQSLRYGEIRAPTAILTGDRDRIVYAHIHSAGCARDIPGATMTTLRGIGHSPHYSAPDATAAVILDIAARADSAGAAGAESARGSAALASRQAESRTG
jgi:pimeloyl-ACP methyl ester carboxylesterase